MELTERFDLERLEVEDLARVGRDGVEDPRALRARILDEQDPHGEWQRRWLIAPLTAAERFRAAHRALATLLDHERARLAQLESAIAAIQARHAETPVGRPERGQLEARAREAVAHGEQLRHNVLELERRLTLTPDPTPIVDAARLGLKFYLPVVLTIVAEALAAPLNGYARQVAETATDLLAGINQYEALVARAEQAAGQPLRVPRPSCPAREALEAVGRAGGVEWSWPETSASTVGVTTGNPAPKAP